MSVSRFLSTFVDTILKSRSGCTMIVRMVDDVAVQGEVEIAPREGRGLSESPTKSATATVKSTSQTGTNALARELTDIIHLLSARGSRAPVPSWLVGRLVTYRDHLEKVHPGGEEPS